MATFSQTVTVSANDARFNSNGTYQNGTQVPLGQFGGVSGNLVSYFSPVSIPRGAVITSANLSVYVAGTTATPVLLIGKVGNEANAAMPTTYAACVAAAKTSGTAYSKNWASSSGYQTADITAEVQALVNRADWVSGNSLVAYLLDNGSASGKYATVDMYDMNVSHAPMIDITYTVLSGSGSLPGHAFNNGSGYSGNRRAFVAGGLNLGGF